MKTIKFFTLSIFLLLVAAACGDKKEVVKKDSEPHVDSRPAGNLKIAYYNQDTMKIKYLYFVEQDSLIAKKQRGLQSALEGKQKSLENAYTTYQNRMKAGQLSQVDDQKYQQKLQNMQNEMMQYQQVEGQKLEAETVTKLEDIGNKIDAAAKIYCKKHGIDMLLVYGKGGQFSYINDAFDVTEEFTNFLNEEEERIKEELK